MPFSLLLLQKSVAFSLLILFICVLGSCKWRLMIAICAYNFTRQREHFIPQIERLIAMRADCSIFQFLAHFLHSPYFLQYGVLVHNLQFSWHSSITSFLGFWQAWLWHTQQQHLVMWSKSRRHSPVVPLAFNSYSTPYRHVTFLFISCHSSCQHNPKRRTSC